MKLHRLDRALFALTAVLSLTAAPALADEGLWPFDNVPTAAIRQATGVTIDQAWLNRVQAASVRLPVGCSASVVSRRGLVATNHHCVQDCLQAMSTPARDALVEGFWATTEAQEYRCPGGEAEVLVSITDITRQVHAATAGRTGAAFVQAQTAAMTAAEASVCGSAAHMRCETVNFYQGGQYKVYRYRVYDDVRLVFTPELAASDFGGDPDNFNFPRFALDAAFLRLYENNRPATTPAFLRWNAAAPRDGQPVFVSGNPGSTQRGQTVAELETERDLTIPGRMLRRAELRGRLVQFMTQAPDNRRIVGSQLLDLENSYKSDFGSQLALTDPSTFPRLQAAETELRRRFAANTELATSLGDPWADIAATQAVYRAHWYDYAFQEPGAGGGSALYDYARTIVRGAQERARPSVERLPEYADSRLEQVEGDLTAERPVEPAYERIVLEHWLSKSREYLTADAPATRMLLGRESPEGLAERLVTGTRLGDPAVRRRLWEGGLAAVQASDDPMIQYVLRTDAAARAARRQWEEQVEGPIGRAHERIAQARFALLGASVYPDATFTLRFNYGRVAGWTWRGQTVGPFTTFAGLYERATGADPFRLSTRWIDAQSRLNPATVYNFATDNDVVGGNSGSPALDADGRVIGLVFDGNIWSLGGDYFFEPANNRTVVVSSAAINEALTVVYNLPRLVQELNSGG